MLALTLRPVLQPCLLLMLILLLLLPGQPPSAAPQATQAQRADAAPAAGTASSADPVVLQEDRNTIELWPLAQVLHEQGQPLSLADALDKRASFAPHGRSSNNLGRLGHGVWLKWRLLATPAARHWVLVIKNPLLDDIRVHVLDGTPDRAPVQMGRLYRPGPKAVHSGDHASLLSLPAGREVEVYMRVQTVNGMILPVSLVAPITFSREESNVHLLQGLLQGLALCLLAYSLAQGLLLRERLFLWYALGVAGISLFYFSYAGLAPRYLWDNQPWLTLKVTLASLLVTLAGVSRFFELSLDAGTSHPRSARFLRTIPWLAVAIGALHLSDAVPYSAVQIMLSGIGILMMLVALPVAWDRMRAGDRAARFVMFGLFVFAIGVACIVGLGQGLLPSNIFTRQTFAMAMLCEMLMWMGVLSLRGETLRRAAHRNEVERRHLHALASTDALTGLANRRQLHQHLDEVLPLASNAHQTALLLIDLDGFKGVNDRFGHETGDALLNAAARRIADHFPAGKMVARLGGDEFVCVADGLPDETRADQLAEQLLAAFDEPFEIKGRRMSLGLTIGYALAPADAREAGHLMRLADQAMYRGKIAGRHRAHRAGEQAMRDAESLIQQVRLELERRQNSDDTRSDSTASV